MIKGWTAQTPLPQREMLTIDRMTLALFAGGSGDHNPLHLDPDFARAAGLGDVIGHGMLTMAMFGRYLTEFAPQTAIASLSTRFTGMSHLGEIVRCSGRIIAIEPVGNGRLISLELQATTGLERPLASGLATLRDDQGHGR